VTRNDNPADFLRTAYATNVPIGDVMISPSSCSWRIIFCTVDTARSYSCASPAIDGSREPGGSVPSSIWPRMIA
jgi:hypothetical protein